MPRILPIFRTVTSVNGQTGDVTVSTVTYGTTSGTATEGNDARVADTITTLTDGATISWDATTRRAAVTLGGNRTLANPTNLTTGGIYVLEVIQDGTGGRTLAYGSTFSQTSPIRGTASAKTTLMWQYDGTKLVPIGDLSDVVPVGQFF